MYGLGIPGIIVDACNLIGATNPMQVEHSTIRGDLAIQVGMYVVHGSDSHWSNQCLIREVDANGKTRPEHVCLCPGK